MHHEILNENQKNLLPVLSEFKKEYYMAEGTAIALYIGHRYSVDFDMFKMGNVKPKKIISVFEKNKKHFEVTLNIYDQLNLISDNVKFTFLNYEFDIPHSTCILNSIYIPSLLDLSAMKAYTLGRRSKWKDYLDLYFILSKYHSIREICNRAQEIFGDLFSEKLFRSQLSYFVGISYDEKVDFINGFNVDDISVKNYLTEISLSDL